MEYARSGGLLGGRRPFSPKFLRLRGMPFLGSACSPTFLRRVSCCSTRRILNSEKERNAPALAIVTFRMLG